MNNIGLLDWDLTQWKQPIVFNLEIMKMAQYFRNKRKFIQMLYEVDDRYEVIFLQKDIDDGYYPQEIFTNEKIKMGGRVFSNDIYTPMDMAIEKMEANTQIYNRMKKYYNATTLDKTIYNQLTNASHLRLSLDEKDVWGDYEIQLNMEYKGSKTLIFHDKDIVHINNTFDAVVECTKHFTRLKGARVGFKHPLVFNSKQEMIKWSILQKAIYFNSITINYPIDHEDFILLSSQSIKGLASYNGKNLEEDFFNGEGFTNFYLGSLFAVDHGLKILLNIDAKKISEEWRQFLQLYNDYLSFKHDFILRTKTSRKINLFQYARLYSNWITKDLIETFDFIKEKNYELYKLFYECSHTIEKNGKITSAWQWKSN